MGGLQGLCSQSVSQSWRFQGQCGILCQQRQMVFWRITLKQGQLPHLYVYLHLYPHISMGIKIIFFIKHTPVTSAEEASAQVFLDPMFFFSFFGRGWSPVELISLCSTIWLWFLFTTSPSNPQFLSGTCVHSSDYQGVQGYGGGTCRTGLSYVHYLSIFYGL